MSFLLYFAAPKRSACLGPVLWHVTLCGPGLRGSPVTTPDTQPQSYSHHLNLIGISPSTIVTASSTEHPSTVEPIPSSRLLRIAQFDSWDRLSSRLDHRTPVVGLS